MSSEAPSTEPAPEASEEARRAELEALFRQWEESPPELGEDPAPPRVSPGTVRRRLITTLLLMALTAWVMYSTRASVAYWLEPTTPADLGDLRARWVAGERDLGANSNSHVAVKGLIPSRLIGVTSSADGEKASDADIEYIFFCPLFHITVLTAQPIRVPNYRMPEITGEMAPVVEKGLAFPAETLVRFDGAGRLLRGDEAPPSLRDYVLGYAKRMELDVTDTWVLLDGKPPSDETAGVIIWGMAALPPLVSLFFLIRAWRRTRAA